MIAEGMDPIHATYVFIHHIATSFAENVSQLPEMRTFIEDYVNAEDAVPSEWSTHEPAHDELLFLLGIFRSPNWEYHGHARKLPD